jgi:lactate dehydrogenase-like 2-hydroxyacid dehydrogenase
MSKPALLNTGPMMKRIEEGIAKAFEVHRLHEAGDQEALLRKIGPAVRAICTGSHTGVTTDEALMARFPHLKIIGNFGVGYDTIDVAVAARRGVVITNTPDVLTEEVADTALGLLLCTVREFYRAERWLRDGHWAKEGDYRLTAASLRDRSVGIAGFGRIGKAIAHRIEAFGLQVSYYGRNPQPGVRNRYYSDLVAMARDVDTLIVVIPGGPATANLIDARVLDALGARGILINVARGSVVDETALIAALAEGRLGHAALDVFESEPVPSPEVLKLSNVIVQPHHGSATLETRTAIGQLMIDNLSAHFAGLPLLTPVR